MKLLTSYIVVQIIKYFYYNSYVRTNKKLLALRRISYLSKHIVDNIRSI